MNKEAYEKNLKEKQQNHLSNIEDNWMPCMHDSCQECIGTGVKKTGEKCIHAISCPCNKCSSH